MISISGAPPNGLVAVPPPPYYDNYSGPANPACFLTLDSPTDWAGQSFTTTTKYNLAQIELWIKKGPGSNVGTVYCEVWPVDGNGHPTGQALARGTILDADVSEDYGWVSFDMDTFSLTYYLLSAATKYCVVVQGPNLTGVNSLIWACGGDGSDYPNGDQEWTTTGGGAWATDTTRDQLFRCYPSEFMDNYSGTVAPFTAIKLDSANDWGGQIFTAMKSYPLNRIDIWGKKVGAIGDLLFQLYHVDGEEHPDIVGGVLAQGVIHNADFSADYAWNPCEIDYNLVVDTKYAIVVHGFSLNPGAYIFWPSDNDAGVDDYAPGTQEWSTNGGGSWATQPNSDFLFRCYSA